MGKPKRAGFEAFVPDGEAVAVPIENLGECIGAIEKHEQMPVERIGVERVADHAEQAVERFPHVDRRGAERNLRVGRYAQHDARTFKSSATY